MLFKYITNGVLLYMKYIAKYLSLSLLLSTAGILGSCCPTSPTGYTCAPIRTTWVPITVGQNLYTQYHKLLFPEGFEEYQAYDDCDACSWATDFSVTYRFMQTRNPAQIASALWGANTLLFQGADMGESRSNTALIAEYFGMGPDTNGAVTFCPRLRNQVLDFQLAISGAKFWAQINLPATYAKWALTPNCGAPNFQGNYGTGNLDGAEVVLAYPTTGAMTVAGTIMTPIGTTTNSYFDGGANLTKTNSFIGAIDEAELTNVYTGAASIDPTQVTLTSGVTGKQNIGSVEMGLYGKFDNGGVTQDVGVTAATFTTQTVSAAPDPVTALGGYTFGMVKAREFNLFNVNPCGKWNLADIPIMVGYDFCKSDASHLGVYLKFVIPTGTRINPCLLQYVLTPVIGNGRHFEFGVGLTGHANIWSCDTSSFGVYGDGYIDYMYGACQTRTFDLPGQPMSRYALVYPLQGDQTAGYTVGDTMAAVGDLNLYQGNVNATRGEFMVDFIWACNSWEIGAGYAFTGQTSEKMNCNACGPLGLGNAYALVGETYQQLFGVGPVTSTDNTTGTFTTEAYKDPAALTNFFYLGQTGNAAQVAKGENPAFVYGSDTPIDEAAFGLPQGPGNCSGLMSSQILNKIFGHIDYVWRDCAWQPEIGIVGSVGFVPQGKPTANYWDLGARVGFAF